MQFIGAHVTEDKSAMLLHTTHGNKIFVQGQVEH